MLFKGKSVNVKWLCVQGYLDDATTLSFRDYIMKHIVKHLLDSTFVTQQIKVLSGVTDF